MSKQVAEIFAERASSRLKDLKKSTGWLGEQLGINGSGVRKVLNEKRSIGIDNLARWAQALECDPLWLMGMDGKPSEYELRLACISSVLKIDVKHLPVVRHYLEKMLPEFVDANAKGKKDS